MFRDGSAVSGPRQREETANYELARALQGRHPQWNSETAHAEKTHIIRDAPAKRPDILVHPPRSYPVVVETEFDPARTVEADAVARLGERLETTGAPIEGALAVCLPELLQEGNLSEIASVQFRYATYSLDADGQPARYPEEGWLHGGVDELADAIEHLSISERQLAQGTRVLEQVVREAAALLAEHAGASALEAIAEELRQSDSEQTQRMAAAIFASAFVFHAAIEEQPGIPAVPTTGTIGRRRIIEAWDQILAINYWPVFGIARDLAARLPVQAAPPIMGRIARSLAELSQLGATTYHDLCGRMFQTLISDRKFLATFYTLPPSACLLAELAVEKMDVDWSDADGIGKLRIGDFACGTGALLSAVQRAIYRRFRRAGGDDRELHRRMMEEVLTGLDIMPAAAHLTCSMLSAAHPGEAYDRSRIYTMPYGHKDGALHIGSLDLLQKNQAKGLFDVEPEQQTATGIEAGGRQVDVPHGSFDLVIMNPPFTRPTNHEAHHADIPVPSFAGFGTSHDEQSAMSEKLKKSRGPCGNGNAGLASNFMDLAHAKLKDGGALALVLPFSFAQGKSWEKARKTLAKRYSGVHVVSIAKAGNTGRAFSADTGMAECLVVASKGRARTIHARQSSLEDRPQFLMEAAIEAKLAGNQAINADLLDMGASGVRSASVSRAARELRVGRLCLPRDAQGRSIPIAPLSDIAERGLVHRDINGGPTGSDRTGPPRGPFEVRAIRPGEVPEWPMLWAHDAARERSFLVQPDRCGEPRPGDASRAKERWDRVASRLHSNLEFQLNSQSLAMCLTPEVCLGGRAWPNVIPHESGHEIPLLLWANTTLGMIGFWWTGTRQQQGRANLTITRVPDLPALDTRTLSSDQIELCEVIFEELKNQEFLPANEAYRDPARKKLDKQMLVDVLGLDEALLEGLDTLRLQWCAEPSVHGNKKTRPPL